jgi:hypothetical protein
MTDPPVSRQTSSFKKNFTTNLRNAGNPDLNRSSQRPRRIKQSGGILIPHARDQKFRQDVSFIEENRFTIFMPGVPARHIIVKHYLNFPDFLNKWLNPSSSRSLRASVQIPFFTNRSP